MKQLTLMLIAFMLTMPLMAQGKVFKRPQYLKAGDKIAIISPASVPEKPYVDSAAIILRKWGYEPIMGTSVLAQHGTFAGTVEQRKADLEWAFKNPEIKAVMCSRGGYGSIQELSEMDMKIFSENPKWLIGYSDITAVHGAILSEGVMSIHAHMCEHLTASKGEDASSKYLRDLLRGKLPTYTASPSKYNQEGKVKGTLIGGNMSVMGGSSGSAIDMINCVDDDMILFVEDVSESLTSVDRMLYHLKVTGVLGKLKGLIVGDFHGYKGNEDYDDMYDLIHSVMKDYNIPVAYGFPVGHVKDNYPMIEGAKVSLDVNKAGVVLKFL